MQKIAKTMSCVSLVGKKSENFNFLNETRDYEKRKFIIPKASMSGGGYLRNFLFMFMCIFSITVKNTTQKLFQLMNFNFSFVSLHAMCVCIPHTNKFISYTNETSHHCSTLGTCTMPYNIGNLFNIVAYSNTKNETKTEEIDELPRKKKKRKKMCVMKCGFRLIDADFIMVISFPCQKKAAQAIVFISD